MTETPMRILHVVGGMRRGGIETWLVSLHRRAFQWPVSIDYAVHTMEKCTYDDEIRNLGGRIIPCMHPTRPWMYMWNFRRIIATYGPYDVVHSHTYWFSGFVLRLAHAVRVPHRIAHVYPHEDLKRSSLTRRFYRAWMGRWIERHATLLLADSQAALDSVESLGRCTTVPRRVMHPVVDLSPFARPVDRDAVRRKYKLPDDQPVAVYVARFYPHKNHRAVLEIADRLKEIGVRVHIVLAGASGPSVAKLREAIEGRRDVSMFIDIDDVSEVMHAGDLFVFPSLNEGFGIVALEAQAAGLPVVATNLPGIGEALAPSLRCLTFQPDDLDRAATNIAMILSDPALHSHLAKESQQWARHFQEEDSFATLYQFYRGEVT